MFSIAKMDSSDSSDSGGLGVGAIAGIIIAVLILITIVLYSIYMRKEVHEESFASFAAMDHWQRMQARKQKLGLTDTWQS